MNSAATRDRGMTLIELLIVMSVIGIIAGAIVVTFAIVLRVAPETEFKIDDARSTRGLQTWLARDVASTPPEVYTSASGVGLADENALGAPTFPTGDLCTNSGTTVLFLAWNEDGTPYRSQYTIEGSSASGYAVFRNLCGGESGRNRVTGDIENSQCAVDNYSTYDPLDSTVDICLVSTRVGSLAARSANSKEIVMSVTSRNGDV